MGIEYFINDNYVYLETSDILFSYGLEITESENKDRWVFKVNNRKTGNVAFELTQDEIDEMAQRKGNSLNEYLTMGIGIFLEVSAHHYNSKKKSIFSKFFN